MKQKINTGIIIRLSCLALLIASSVILCRLMCIEFEKYAGNPSGRIEVNIKSIYKKSSNMKEDGLLDYNAASALKSSVKENTLSYYSQIDTNIDARQRSIPVRLLLSDENLLDNIGGTVFKGSPLYSTACVKGDEVAVISEDMANELFMSVDILGEHIYIDGKKYRIIGIYRQKNALYKKLVWDGTNTIFIPYKSYTAYETIPIHTIILRDISYERLVFRTDRFLDTINSLKRVDDRKYDIKDFYDFPIAVRQQYNIIVFVSGSALEAILLVVLFASVKSKYFIIRNALKKQYFIELLADNARRIAADILIYAVWIAVCSLIIKLILFKPFIPGEAANDAFGHMGNIIVPYKSASDFMTSPFMHLYQFVMHINTMLIVINVVCNALVLKLIMGLGTGPVGIKFKLIG